MFCCLASSNWPISMWRSEHCRILKAQEHWWRAHLNSAFFFSNWGKPCPHVPLLLILHFLLILRLSFTRAYDLGIYSCTFPPILHKKLLRISPICCPKIFELLPSILIPPLVPDMSDLLLMYLMSVWNVRGIKLKNVHCQPESLKCQ